MFISEIHLHFPGTPEFEFNFDEYLKNKKSTNNKIDDVHQSDKSELNYIYI